MSISLGFDPVGSMYGCSMMRCAPPTIMCENISTPEWRSFSGQYFHVTCDG
jgi:hypothetical protein